MYGDKVLDEEQAKGTPMSQWKCFVLNFAFHIISFWGVFLFKFNHSKKCTFFCAALAGLRVRGWFPRRCVEKCHYDSANNTPACEEKKDK